MSARGFGSVFAVGGIAVAALGCYLVSLRVASERAALESVENKIVLAQRDIRLLSTEIGTRGRLSQLERWNVKVIRLSAPTADQFVESSFQLATLVRPEAKPAIEAPVVLASAPAPRRDGPVVTSDSGVQEAAPRVSRPLGEMMHIASYSKPEPKPSRMAPVPFTPKAAAKPAAGAKANAEKEGAAKVGAAKASTGKSAKSSSADPLSPLPTLKAAATKSAPTKMASTKNGAKTGASSDSGSGARTTTRPAKEPGSHQ